MLVTVTNASTKTLNKEASPRDMTAYGGQKVVGGDLQNRLPHPFGLVGEIAPGGNVQRSMHHDDLQKQRWLDTHRPVQHWNDIIQAGTVTVAIAAETDNREFGDDFIDAI